MKIVMAMTLTIFTTGCSFFGIRSEETPLYEVVRVEGDYEIRKYSPHILATTTVKGPYKEAQRKAFRRLAGYIFGKNEKHKEIAMTAPVLQEKQKGKSEKIAMTAPVIQQETGEGWKMSFVMPSKYTRADLPLPLESGITFEDIPEKYFAAVRYSWFFSEANNNEHTEMLEQWLGKQTDYQAHSAPISAGYDPPWTLPMFRRNEVLIEVKPKTTPDRPGAEST